MTTLQLLQFQKHLKKYEYNKEAYQILENIIKIPILT
jgi:hypothetical protein